MTKENKKKLLHKKYEWISFCDWFPPILRLREFEKFHNSQFGYRSKFASDYYLAGTKFTRLDALKDAMPFLGSISGGNTTVSLFFFCFIYYSEEKRKERESMYKYKRDDRKQFQSVAFFLSQSCFSIHLWTSLL